MSARNFLQVLGAGGQATLPAGRYFFVKQATFPITITTKGNTGSPVTFSNIGAGSKFGPVAEGQGWRELQIDSAAAQTLEIIISDDGLFEVANSVTVAGAVQVQDIPSAGLTDTSDTALASGAESTIPANGARARITIGVPSNALNSVRVSQAGGAGRGIEIQPGTNQTFPTTGALKVRNDNLFGTGAATSWYAEEE
jgi:hypothetical protein